jgi:hypothetical protein
MKTLSKEIPLTVFEDYSFKVFPLGSASTSIGCRDHKSVPNISCANERATLESDSTGGRLLRIVRICVLLGATLALFAGGNALALTRVPAPTDLGAGTHSPPVTLPPSSSTKAAPAPSPTSPQTAEDIRDIRQPIHIPYPWLWAAYVAGGVAAAGLLLGLLRRWRHPNAFPVKMPHEMALVRLEQVRALMTPEQAREFSFAVSEIVREYIEQRFQGRAAHRTTEEFLHDLVTEPDALLANHRALLADFLWHCDLAKFALWNLTPGDMESMHLSARTFVLQTVPTAAESEDVVQKDMIPRSARAHLDPPVPSQTEVLLADAVSMPMQPPTAKTEPSL